MVQIRWVIGLLLSLWLSQACAGSYDDFFMAIRQDNDAAIAQLLERGFDPNTPSTNGQTGLLIALRESSLKAVHALLQQSTTKVETRSAEDESPLMLAALRGYKDICEVLIARDADVNKSGWTPLHYAATGGHTEIVLLLLENYAYIDAESPNGSTPLMMAAMYGNVQTVEALLDAGADTTLQNQLGLTALDFAVRGNRPDAIALLSRKKVNPVKDPAW